MEGQVAITGGRYLLGLSNASRQAAGVVTGDEVEVEIDAEPRVVAEPADFARAFGAQVRAGTVTAGMALLSSAGVHVYLQVGKIV